MTILLADMTRDEIAEAAPDAVVILPTASIEQHGPHLPIGTDTTLCGTVAARAARDVEDEATVLVAPTLCFGNSHHHRPFAGVLSLSSTTYMTVVTEILEGLALSGFRKLVLLNGHGGNTDSNNVVAQDFVHRLGHDVEIATADYWDIARPALLERFDIADDQIPGHAGYFETAMMLALDPALSEQERQLETHDVSEEGGGVSSSLIGGTVRKYGTWAAGTGYTDDPSVAKAELGQAMLNTVVSEVAKFFLTFNVL